MRRVLALVLSAALFTGGCASASGGRFPQAQTTPSQSAALASVLQQMAPGTRLKVELRSGERLKATLLKATPDVVTLSPRTRIPEPPLEVPIADVLGVEHDTSGGVARSIAIGASAGAGAALGVMLILWAILGGD